jgi:anti-sigma factor (TIGR02949 family)
LKNHDQTHDDIGCLEAIETLYAYLDGELDDDISIEQVEEHMEHCRSCYSRKDVERALTEHLRRTGKKNAPAELKDRLNKLIDEF